jgi:hypothetical protein
MWKEAVVAELNVLHRLLPAATAENDYSSGYPVYGAEIWTEDLINTEQES